MIKKCNTNTSKSHSTPYNHIQVSQFITQQPHCPEQQHQQSLTGYQLEYNISKIRQCKQQTHQFITDINNQLTLQDQQIQQLREMYQKQKSKAKLFRSKYHEATIKLRQKDQEYQSLQKRYHNQQQTLNFLRKTSDQNTNQLLLKQQQYRQTIHLLQYQLQLAKIRPFQITSLNPGYCQQDKTTQTIKSNSQSTFI